MPRLDRLPQINRNTVLQLPVQVNDGGPFTRPAKPLAACRIVIPSDTPAADLVQNHTSLGFDRTPTMRDVNVSFPVDRLRELVARGALGGLGPHHYSFMGAQRDVPLPNFIRSCADDLKALYFEGHMAMQPAVRDRLHASADPGWKAAAFGVAR